MSKIKFYINFLSQPKFLICYFFILFILLLARNPYSDRTLIPNLEPYPDSMHYVVPARSFIKSGVFKITREGRQLTQSVPPLYSISIMPFYLINFDARTFYFANIVLSLVSLCLFYLILKKITNNRFVIGLILFLYVTNYYLYWYPQWAMAENLILPIFMVSIYLLLLPITKKHMIYAALVPACVYATKYAYLPFSVLYFFVYIFKMYTSNLKSKSFTLIKFIFWSSFFALFSLGFQYFFQGVNPLARYIDVLIGIFSFGKPLSGTDVETTTPLRGWFSDIFFRKNFPLYLKGFMGQRVRFLWDYTPILEKYLTIMSWLGLTIAVNIKKLRFLAISLIIFVIPYILVISTFSTFDMRYIYYAGPLLLIGFAMFLIFISQKFSKKKYVYFILIVAVLSGYYLYKNAIRIKNQIVLNLKYAETPWYYNSVLELNKYFTEDKIVNGEKPIVISPMPPYYIDFFSNGNYRLLPLSKVQEFRLNKEEAWGPGDYSDLHALYKSYLDEGKVLYLSTYGLGVEEILHRDFNDIQDNFKLTLVWDSCYSQCKIYKVDEK